MFRVVPDQLRVSDGWVRCGQCDEVFDANLHLQEEAAEGIASTQQQTPEVPSASRSYDWGPDLDGSSPTPTPTVVEASLAAEPVDPFLHKSPHELAGTTFSIAPDALDDPVWDSKANLSQLAPELDTAANAAQPRYVQGSAPASLQQEAASMSFMRPAPVVRKRRPLVTAAWWSVALVSVSALALQVIHHERATLAAHIPQSRPVLNALCEFAGCVVSPMQRVESLVIDSSSFVKVHDGVYRLNFTIKNTGTFAVAAPAIELALTDLQDQPVIRRVLSASESGAKSPELAAVSEWSASVPLAVRTAGADKIAGYRMLVFYP